ncbi:DUF4328 domain-containing protein [Herbidospora sp. NEAU-GS84]|uniref:DUF4328 domain-containing protein n=1 Tax=Herbidospora solisilvae TaxID=2696284 RepID=A0A7C9JDB4_9ACTN|nr:DUF4328 domain-containing protein [Herbidospora solisilvae]NAS24284.1 DUF4328 domain-containing protein [Herbidospora solisilvae]
MHPVPVRPARGLAVVTTVAIALNLLVEAAAVFVSLDLYQKIGEVIASPLDFDVAAVTESAELYDFTGILQGGTLLLAGIFYWVWLFRVRTNAQALAPHVKQRLGGFWLVFGWIVPIVSFWFPKQIVDDIWTASHPQQHKPGGLVTTWWVTWVLAVFGSNLVARFLIGGSELPDLRNAALVEMLVFPLILVSGVLAIVVVNRITSLQRLPRPVAPYLN